MGRIFLLISVVCFSGSSLADSCRKSGENYTADNMNLPACETNSGADPFTSGSVWGSESSFNSSGNGSMGSTFNQGSNTGSASGSGTAAAGARGEHTSTGSGWKAGGTGSGWKPGTTGSGNSREPASALPTQNSQVQQQQPVQAPAGDVNSTVNNSGGDARWIK